MKNRTKKIISFLAVIMFIIGSYGMGNGFFDTLPFVQYR